MDRVIIVGKTYKHFKGNEYKVLLIANDTESDKEIVIYEETKGIHKLWAREYDMFNSLVDKDKYPNEKQVYRFELID